MDSNLLSSDDLQLLELHTPQTPSEEKKNPKHHRLILDEEVQSLYAAREKLRDFVSEIGILKTTSVRKDVINHCDKIRINLHQNLNYDKVEKMVKNRIEKMIKNKRIKKNWSEEDVLILIWVTSKYADSTDIHYIERDLTSMDWNRIAELIPGVEGESCMFKWLSLKKNNLSDNNWSEKESILLDRIVKKFGENDWTLVSHKLYYSNYGESKIYRCPKQCRQHWNCYLNPKLKKGPWSREEDILLLDNIVKNNGLKKWAEMVKLFNGRTENALKNRFTLILEKEMKNHPNAKRINQLKLVEDYLDRIYVQQFVNIKNENMEDQLEAKQRSKLYKLSKINAQVSKRHSLRKRPDAKGDVSCAQSCIEKSILKIEEDHENYYQIYYHEKLAPEEEFSVPCQIVQNHCQIFEQEEEVAQSIETPMLQRMSKCQNEELPGIDSIKIVPLDQQMLDTLKSSLLKCEEGSKWGYVPCAIMENKLTKLKY